MSKWKQIESYMESKSFHEGKFNINKKQAQMILDLKKDELKKMRFLAMLDIDKDEVKQLAKKDPSITRAIGRQGGSFRTAMVRKRANEEVKEDAPTNSVASGGVDMNPTGKKRVMGTLKRKVQESDDNNNVVLKGVYSVLNKLEEKIDELSGVVKEEIKIETPKRKKTIKEKARV